MNHIHIIKGRSYEQFINSRKVDTIGTIYEGDCHIFLVFKFYLLRVHSMIYLQFRESSKSLIEMS